MTFENVKFENPNYKTGLQVQDWIDLLKNPKLYNSKAFIIIKGLYTLNGCASCTDFALNFGQTPNFFSGKMTEFANLILKLKKVKNPRSENLWFYNIFFDCFIKDGKKYFVFRKELKEAIEILNFFNNQAKNDNSSKNKKDINNKMKNSYIKNQILYGPPGTGKTYNTVVETMRIMMPKLIQDYEHNLKDENKDNQKRSDDGKIINYEFLKDKFDILKQQGRIEFVTFHQSYSYEEFVEGIKPVLNAEQIQYEKKKGVFKQICENASEKTESNFDEVYEKFINDVIEHYDSSEEPYKLKTSKNRTFAISVNSKNNLSLLTGPSFNHTGTLTKHNLKHLSDWKYYATPIHKYLVDEFKLIENETVENRPYVLIIDEINRGNISKIFGELITLLEEDKRVGEKNEVTVRLPYSEPDEPAFGVPSNLYIIGTMNTSDRSIASVDIALRRRFKFKEMMPNENLIKEIGNKEAWDVYDDENKKLYSVNLVELLKTLNKRITLLLDRDHQIGHSYFLDLIKDNNCEIKEQLTETELKEMWFSCIMPLLNEYFYGDWEKLQALLGQAEKNNKSKDKYNSFIKVIENDFLLNGYSCDTEECCDFTHKSEINFKNALMTAFNYPILQDNIPRVENDSNTTI